MQRSNPSELKTAPEIRKKIETLDPETKSAWANFDKFNKNVRKDKDLVTAYGAFEIFRTTLATYKEKEKKDDYSEAIQSICLSIIKSPLKTDAAKIDDMRGLVSELKTFIQDPNLANKYADVQSELVLQKREQAIVLDVQQREAEEKAAQEAKRQAEKDSRDKTLGKAKWLQEELNSLGEQTALIQGAIHNIRNKFNEFFVNDKVLYDSKLSLENKYDVINKRLKQFEEYIDSYFGPLQEKEKKLTKQSIATVAKGGGAALLGIVGAIVSGNGGGLNTLRGFTTESQELPKLQDDTRKIQQCLEFSAQIRGQIDRKISKKKTSSSTAAIGDKVGGLAVASEAKSHELFSDHPDAGDAKRPSPPSSAIHQPSEHHEKKVDLHSAERVIAILDDIVKNNEKFLKEGRTTFPKIKDAIAKAKEDPESIFDNLATAIEYKKMEKVLKEYRNNYQKFGDEKKAVGQLKPHYQFYYMISQIRTNRDNPNLLNDLADLMESCAKLNTRSASSLIRNYERPRL